MKKYYKGRTKEGIKKLKEIIYSKIGDPVCLARRRELNKKDPRIRLRGSAKQRAKERGFGFNIPSYKDLPKVSKNCPILDIPLFVGDGKSTDNSPTLDRIGNEKFYYSVRTGFGYERNIQIISRKANQMKSNGNFKEIEKLYFHMLLYKCRENTKEMNMRINKALTEVLEKENKEYNMKINEKRRKNDK